MIFKNKKANQIKLLLFGFCKEEKTGAYLYTTHINQRQFEMNILISEDGRVQTRLFDMEQPGEEYVLHRIKGASGPFVSMIREAHDAVLMEIMESCFDPDVFKSSYTKAVITHVRKIYGNELEFLWKRASDNAIWRRSDTGKWYAVLMIITKRKLGFDSDESIEVLDLRVPPDEMTSLIDQKRYFPGFHMNKKHWCTICLDGSVSLNEIYRRIAESYRLAVK